MEEKNFKGSEGADNIAPTRVRGGEQRSRTPGEYGNAKGNLKEVAELIVEHKEVLDDTAALVDKIKSGEAYGEFVKDLERLSQGSRKEIDGAQDRLHVYSGELQKSCASLGKKRDGLKEMSWVSNVQGWIKQVPLRVAAAERAAVRAWDSEAREHEDFLQAHGLALEQDNYTYPGKGLPKFERSMPKFMALFLIFFVVESCVNGTVYAQIEEGLANGIVVAAIIAAGVLFFGWLSGVLSSFLKGFERSGAARGGRGMMTSSDAEGGSNRSKMVILALLFIVVLLGSVYFYTHHEELMAKHGLRGTLVAVSAIVVVVGLIMFLWFGKGGTKQDVETAKENHYIPRPVWKRFGYGFGAFFSLLVGITLIMVAYLYREEMLNMSTADLVKNDAAKAVMKEVFSRFGALDFLPSAGLGSIILLLVNFTGFGFAAYKGHWMNGPFQNYKHSRIQYEGFGKKYDDRCKEIRDYRKNCNNYLDEIVNRFPGTVRDVHDLVNKINNEGLLQKRWRNACEKVKGLERNADFDTPSLDLDNISPPELINADEWRAVEDMLASARSNG